MEQKNLRNSVLGGFFWKFCERFLNQGITFVTSLVLARMLMPEDYGTVALVTVFINLASVFLNHGFATALIQDKNAVDRDFSTMFFCSLGCTLVIYAGLYAVAPLVADFYGEPILIPVLRVFALSIPMSALQSIQQAYVSRHLLFRKTVVASGISAVVCGIVGIALAMRGFGVWALVFQNLASVVAGTLVYLVVIPWRPKWEFSAVSAKKMMNFGSRVLAAEFSATLFAEIRGLLIGKVHSNADLAYYNKGNQVPHLITNNITGVLVSVMLPTISNFSDDLPRVKQLSKRCMKLLAYVLVPCMFGLAAVMEPLILFLYSERWAQAIPFGQILSIDVCIALIANILLQIMKAVGRGDVVLKLEFWKKPVYMLFLLLGVQGDVLWLAYAMLAYDVYAVTLDMLQIKKLIRYGVWEQLKDMLPAFALGTVMAVLVWLIPVSESLLLTLVIKIAAGAAIYLAGSVLCRMEAFAYLWNIVRDKLGKGKE